MKNVRHDDDERDLRAALNELLRMGLVECVYDAETGEDRYRRIEEFSLVAEGEAQPDAVQARRRAGSR